MKPSESKTPMMSRCDHCWHDAGMMLFKGSRVEKEQVCCWCGETRMYCKTDHPPPQHGPCEPQDPVIALMAGQNSN